MTSIKQRKVAKSIIEGNDNVSQAMVEAGYSVKTAHNPHKIIKSKGFRELMEQMGISDEKLAQRLNEGLDATKAVVMGVKSEESFVDIQPDYVTRHKYIETSLKLKGHTIDKPSTNVYQLIQEQKNHYGI